MQRRTRIALLFIVVIIGIGSITLACQSKPESGTTSEQVDEARSISQIVSASGTVVPLRWAVLSFSLGGRIEELAVEMGYEVQAGVMLARLDAKDLEQAVVQAEAALSTARAGLAQVRVGPRPQEIVTAQKEVSAATANLMAVHAAVDQARATLDGATASEASAQARLEAAQAELASAEVRVVAAKAELALLKAGAGSQQRAIAELQIDQARNSLWAAQALRDSIGGAVKRREMRDADLDGAEAAVGNAHVAIDIAELVYEEMEAGPRPEEIAPAQVNVDAALIALKGAEVQVEAARAGLDGAWAQVALAKAQLLAAEAQVDVAQARVGQAEVQLDLIKAGTRHEDVALAQMRVVEAEEAVKATELTLTKAQLLSPFAGRVARLEVREEELVSPGQPILYLGDLSGLQVETTDLNEVDIARVKVGQEVEITFDALPERVFTGRVASIEPIATPGQGGTNYKAIVSLDQLDSDLRWGMTAFVDIAVSD